MTRNLSNVPASVHDRLLNQARDTGRPFNELLQYYGIERFLYRLAQTEHARRLILKGALLLRSVGSTETRPTRDIDLLGQGPPTEERLISIVREAMQADVPEDGMTYDPDTLESTVIAETAEYNGVRLTFRGFLGTARVPMQIDVGFGDPIVPGPIRITYPQLLDYGSPRLLAYTLESLIAEKYQAMVDLELANTRMKDFYDVWMLIHRHAFEQQTLARAIAATFERRRTPVPGDPPLALTEAFFRSDQKKRQWRAFLRNIRAGSPPALPDVISDLAEFLRRPSQAARRQKGSDDEATADASWPPGGPWS
jgi:predicted nucleotidyltransferase component of viral defense system